MNLSRARRLKRRVLGRFAQLFEDSPGWKAHTGQSESRGQSIPWSLTDAPGFALGLPVFNRRVRQYNTGHRDPTLMEKLSQRPGWEPDWAEVEGGVSLAGAVARPRQPDAPWVLYFLGNWGDQLVVNQPRLEQLRADQDLGLAMWAPRGFELSGGEPSMRAFCTDALRLHHRLIEKFGARDGAIHLVGFSMGALVANELANQLFRLGRPAASLSVLSFQPQGFAVRRKSARWFAPWLLPEWYSPATLPKELPHPVLIVHGERDELEHVEDTRGFAQLLGDRVRYLELEGGNHESTHEPRGLAAVRAVIETASKSR